MSYKVDPDNNLKMIPNAKIESDAFGYAINPNVETIQKRPSYVIINVNGIYAFSNNNVTASLGGTHTDRGGYTTGSVLNDAAGGPLKLDIQPNAWRQTNAAGDVGDVTFVYRGD